MKKVCMSYTKQGSRMLLFLPKSIDIFFSFLHKDIYCGYSLEAHAEALLMSTHNKYPGKKAHQTSVESNLSLYMPAIIVRLHF